MNTFLRRTCRAAIVLAVLAALICSGALTGSTAEARDPRPQPSADPQVEVLEKLRVEAGAPTNVTFRNGFPRIVHTSVAIEGSSPVERARRYLAKYKGLYGQFMDDPFAGGQVEENRLGIADPSDRLRDHLRKLETYQGKRTSTPDLGLAVRGTAGPGDRAVAFYQTYKGIEVFGGNVLVFVDGDKVVGTVGSLLSDVQLDVLPRLADSDAEVAARRALGVRGAPALARTELVVFDRSLLPQEGFTRSEPHLAWRVALADRGRHVAFVDASSGELLFSHSQVRDHSDDYDLDLEDANGEESNSTNCYWDTTADDALGDEDGLNASGQADPEAVALWKHAKDAYDFYHDAFGLHSYDDDDGQYELYVHANVPNARWVPGSVDCDLIEFANGWVAYDVLVHELGHGTLDFGFFGGPVYQGQPGALDESFADTMGALADGNYLIGEDLASGAIRSLSNPPAFNHPDRLSEFVMTSGDNGGVHTNSGIGNKAAFLLAEGGTHPDTSWTVSGIGRPAVAWLANSAGMMLPPNAGFLEMRGLMITHASLTWGGQAACQVRNAWAAVEVGNGDVNCDGVEESPDGDGDGVNVPLDNCPDAANPSQLDTDGDGKGNACDGDADEDGVLDPGYAPGLFADNCPGVPNPDQKDANFNGIGAACDPSEDGDMDDDGIADEDDNCVLDANADQADVDDDGYGDACDPDSDGDGWSNDDDNCPFTPNPGQEDADGDGVGDACDGCPETENEVLAWTMGIPELGIDPRPVEPDLDGDGTPDVCDPDSRVGGKLPGLRNLLASDGVAREISTHAGAGTYLRIPLGLSADKWPRSFGQHERRELVVRGIDPRIRTWVSDDTGRAVARPKPKAGEARTLRFRPLAGRRYFLYLNFSEPYGKAREDTFSATMSVEQARYRDWAEAPAIGR